MDSQKKSRIEIDAVITRMKQAAGVSSIAALSKHVGYRSNALQNTVSRGHVPYKDAAALAEIEGVSLDWLIFGPKGSTNANGPEGPKRDRLAPVDPDQSQSDIYARAARNPALFVADDDEDDAAWSEKNRRAQDVLREVVEGVEVALSDSGLVMPPAKKAELIATLFEIYASAHAKPSRNHILRLVRSAS